MEVWIIPCCGLCGQETANLIKQEAFEKCWAHSPLRAAARPFTRCRYCCTRASMSTTTTTTTLDRGDRYGPMEWAQLWIPGLQYPVTLTDHGKTSACGNEPIAYSPKSTSTTRIRLVMDILARMSRGCYEENWSHVIPALHPHRPHNEFARWLHTRGNCSRRI